VSHRIWLLFRQPILLYALTGGRAAMDEDLSLPDQETESPLIDAGDLSLDKVAQLGDSVLGNSLDRYLGDAKNPDSVMYASFSATV
jgi:hypothetical protein